MVRFVSSMCSEDFLTAGARMYAIKAEWEAASALSDATARDAALQTVYAAAAAVRLLHPALVGSLSTDCSLLSGLCTWRAPTAACT